MESAPPPFGSRIGSGPPGSPERPPNPIACELELARGTRFKFGKNWSRFLDLLDEERVAQAENSLREKLELADLTGKTFLDIGSGSGMFSLAARRMGARVHSFDYDPQSVACTTELKQRYFQNDLLWTVERGSILDVDYVRRLGLFDVVYSWGVLHHTGAMWQAMENAQLPVGRGGKLFVAIYNDQGGASKRWRAVKRFYNVVPSPLKLVLVLVIGSFWECRSAMVRFSRMQNPLPFKSWSHKKTARGMSIWYDLVDWVGGYPFEVAKPEEVFDFYRKEGFILVGLKTDRGHGCNEFVFERTPVDFGRSRR
jgi:2-polyprenyl-6-hydroxyphenyl methylase/3-demethylubiquinone-9 3-methyltransferase